MRVKSSVTVPTSPIGGKKWQSGAEKDKEKHQQFRDSTTFGLINLDDGNVIVFAF
jgi:hypothetical protein